MYEAILDSDACLSTCCQSLDGRGTDLYLEFSSTPSVFLKNLLTVYVRLCSNTVDVFQICLPGFLFFWVTLRLYG